MIRLGRAKNWTDEEVNYLEDSWGAKSIPAIANKLNRSVEGVKLKAQRLGLTRHIHNGDYITYNQLLVAIGMGETYVRTKFENNGIPIKFKASIKKKYKIIYLEDFWIWAEEHKNLLNFKKFEPGALGPEPLWAEIKRQSDKQKAVQKKTTTWTAEEDAKLECLLNQFKYGYFDIARIMQRTEGAIKRRCFDLNIKARPIKADNHRKWQEWETEMLKQMWSKGYTEEDISIKLDNRSVCAVRGKIERLQYEDAI